MNDRDEKKHGEHEVTFWYIKLGVIIVGALIVVGLLLHIIFRIELGSIADLVGGLGAIAAILGIGWQTAKQNDLDKRIRMKNCRPFSLTMRYLTQPLRLDEVFIYSSSHAEQCLHDQADATIKKILQEFQGELLGSIHIELEGNDPIYNVVVQLDDDNGHEESLHIPILKPEFTYIWLTGKTLAAMGDISKSSKIDKNSLFPEELKKRA